MRKRRKPAKRQTWRINDWQPTNQQAPTQILIHHQQIMRNTKIDQTLTSHDDVFGSESLGNQHHHKTDRTCTRQRHKTVNRHFKAMTRHAYTRRKRLSLLQLQSMGQYSTSNSEQNKWPRSQDHSNRRANSLARMLEHKTKRVWRSTSERKHQHAQNEEIVSSQCEVWRAHSASNSRSRWEETDAQKTEPQRSRRLDGIKQMRTTRRKQTGTFKGKEGGMIQIELISLKKGQHRAVGFITKVRECTRAGQRTKIRGQLNAWNFERTHWSKSHRFEKI